MTDREQELRRQLAAVTGADEGARRAAKRRWDACAKPLGSLGLLETAVERLAALTGSPEVCLTPRALLVLCADNGVVAQGVAQSGSEVTAAVTRNLALGRTSVCRMAAVADCAVVPVDLGVLDFPRWRGCSAAGRATAPPTCPRGRPWPGSRRSRRCSPAWTW